MTDIDMSAVCEEKIRRQVSFDDWLAESSPTYEWHWRHLVYIRKQLDRITKGEIKRLGIFVPPQHGKSELVTVRYPIWRLIRNKRLRIVIGAYNQGYASKFGRKSRRLAQQYISLMGDRKAVNDWETTAGGGYRSVGVGSGITGNPADLILIDDPVKSREEADSKAYREKCWDWFKDDLYTRLQQDAPIILIMTRWHDDDLAGRIQRSEFAADWKWVNLPAIAEDDDPLGRKRGEELCKERFSLTELENRKKVLGSRGWNALYQQRPAPEEGSIFEKKHLQRYRRVDANYIDCQGCVIELFQCERFATVDLAISQKQTADYTVIASWALATTGELILLNLVRERIKGTMLLARIAREYHRFNLDWIGVESVQFQELILQLGRVDGLPMRGLKPKGDKVARANSVVVWAEQGQLFIPQVADWLADYEHEMLHFPFGTHDDMVDATVYALATLQQRGYEMAGAKARKPDSEIEPEIVESEEPAIDSDEFARLREHAMIMAGMED